MSGAEQGKVGHTHELTADSVAELIRPTLDKFVSQAEPFLAKVSEELYEHLLYTVQDYLRENAEWNIGQEIERCRKIEHDNTQLRIAQADMMLAMSGVMPVLATAEGYTNASSEGEVHRDRIKFFQHVYEKHGGAA